jgi:hypothetical protein
MENIYSEWDHQLTDCFSASRGLNPTRFEPGPSELLFSDLTTELSDIWKILPFVLAACFRASRGLNPPKFQPGPSELEFRVLPTELNDNWKIFSSVWDQHLASCFRASRGKNPARFEPGPSELKFSAQPTELSDISRFLWYKTDIWPLASEPAEDWTHLCLNPDHLNSSS